MNKKIIIAVVCMIVGVGICCFAIVNDKKEKEKQPILEKPKVEELITEEDEQSIEAEGKKDILQYENIDGLYFLTKEQIVEMQRELENWLHEEGLTVQQITVYGAIEEHLSEKRWVFYLILDAGRNKIKGTYTDGGEFIFSFTDTLPETEERDIEQARKEEIKVTKEEYANVNESHDPTKEEEEVGEVKIMGVEKLPIEVEITMLANQLTAYLLSEKEYRRELTVTGTVTEEQITKIWLTFQIPRVDKKEVFIIVDKGTFEIQLAEREKDNE